MPAWAARGSTGQHAPRAPCPSSSLVARPGSFPPWHASSCRLCRSAHSVPPRHGEEARGPDTCTHVATRAQQAVSANPADTEGAVRAPCVWCSLGACAGLFLLFRHDVQVRCPSPSGSQVNPRHPMTPTNCGPCPQVTPGVVPTRRARACVCVWMQLKGVHRHSSRL